MVFNESKFLYSLPVQSVPSISHNTTIPTWLSNQLYLHFTNQPSLLGSYPIPPLNPPSNSSTSQSAVDPSLLSVLTPNHVSSSTPSNLSSPSTVAPLPLPTTLTASKPLPIHHHNSNPPDPLPVPTLNSHPMQTRSKNGITKPNSKLCYKATIDYTYTEPPSFKIASKYPEWCEAMDAEFQALQRQQTPVPCSCSSSY